MCFTISDTHPKPLVAEHNILVWKRLKAETFESPVKRYKYKLGRVVHANIRATHPRLIERGLHAYTKAWYARTKFRYSGCWTLPAIIPAGTTYYFNPYKNEIVAERIVVFRTLRDALNACGQRKTSPAIVIPSAIRIEGTAP